MSCAGLAHLGCQQTGVGFLASAWTPSDTTIELAPGQGVNFPTPTATQRYFVDLGGCGCCTRVEVTARAGDVLTIIPPAASDCTCITKHARVAYATNSPEHIALVAQALPFEVVPPLRWDCETRTLSIDCAALKDMVNQPCAT